MAHNDCNFAVFAIIFWNLTLKKVDFFTVFLPRPWALYGKWVPPHEKVRKSRFSQNDIFFSPAKKILGGSRAFWCFYRSKNRIFFANNPSCFPAMVVFWSFWVPFSHIFEKVVIFLSIFSLQNPVFFRTPFCDDFGSTFDQKSDHFFVRFFIFLSEFSFFNHFVVIFFKNGSTREPITARFLDTFFRSPIG